ncbi:HAD family hydrolase [Kitasatospora sp. NPDC051853]|uniref:HAD family hydrolase n=1 Tax=Kitasatospora sp. NPDC051853 TaxID=3364058 RepID=UPI0037AABDE9
MSAFGAVLFDWVGTLVVPKWGPVKSGPSGTWWISHALRGLGRDGSAVAVQHISTALSEAGRRPEVIEGWRGADASAATYRTAYLRWVGAAGLDPALADALYEGLADPATARFASDVAPTLAALRSAGLKVAVISDIHFDIRPAFAEAGLDAYIDEFVLSYEVGVCKPERAIFRAALTSLGLQPHQALMVGDRSAYDGAAIEVGIPTLLVPVLTDPTEERLHLVLKTCGLSAG